MAKRTVQVAFDDGESKHYTYYTNDDTIEVDDICVVEVDGRAKCVKVVKVRGLTSYQEKKASRWIVQKIDFQAYQENVRKEEIIQEIRNKMRKRREDMEDILIYQQLAKSDPEMKALITELEGVDASSVPKLEE